MMDIVKVKSRNMLGIVQIRSKQLDYLGHRSFNNVVLEDGTIMMCRDDDMERVYDRPAEIEE